MHIFFIIALVCGQEFEEEFILRRDLVKSKTDQVGISGSVGGKL